MPLPDGLTATKVVGVHLNYRSRAEQRGRVPAEPSYFLKPPSSISDGGPVIRPQGGITVSYLKIQTSHGISSRLIRPWRGVTLGYL